MKDDDDEDQQESGDAFSYFFNFQDEQTLAELRQPLDPQELRDLAADPVRDAARLRKLILKATAAKDASFRDLVDREDLRADPELGMALAAYDYSVNGNQAALGSILDQLDRPYGAAGRQAGEVEVPNEGVNWTVLSVLSYIDEWDLTLAAFHQEMMHDGCYSTGMSTGCDTGEMLKCHTFSVVRMELFPRNFRRRMARFAKEWEASDGPPSR